MRRHQTVTWLIVITAVICTATVLHAQEQTIIAESLSSRVTIRCHFTDEMPQGGMDPIKVLKAACTAYDILDRISGFSRKGYSFSSPSLAYAYDPDRTIDIYIGDPKGDGSFHGYAADDFRTSYFNTVRSEADPHAYDAVILIPCNVNYLKPKSVESNPTDTDDQVLLGTMVHEMTHLFLFYYNKNLKPIARRHDASWFAEGLARYYETKAGSWDSFYSKGYIRKKERAYAYLEEGVNFYLEHPDRKIDHLQYDFAIFWKYMEETYGGSVIETLAAALREVTSASRFERRLQEAFESATGARMEEILRRYARYLYDTTLNERTRDPRLQKMSHTVSRFDGSAFYVLYDGQWRPLGRTLAVDEGCRIQADDAKAMKLLGVDATEEAGVNPWATDVHKITVEGKACRKSLVIKNLGEARLIVQVIGEDGRGEAFDLKGRQTRWLAEGNRSKRPQQVDWTAHILISNADPVTRGRYEISPG